MRPKRIEADSVIDVHWIDIVEHERDAEGKAKDPWEDLLPRRTLGRLDGQSRKALRIERNYHDNSAVRSDCISIPWGCIESVEVIGK